jgi:UDP-3-O-acyl-N-acetylglucosamine deacetylase
LQLRVRQTIRVGDERGWVQAEPAHHDGLELNYELDYGCENAIGRQSCHLRIAPDTFCEQLAPARTFLLKQEADWLRTQGLGSRVTHRDLLVFDANGPIDNPLRFENECVRHKALDVVGDLALLGQDVIGRVTAFRSGHRLNAELVRGLLRQAAVDPRGPELPRRQLA